MPRVSIKKEQYKLNDFCKWLKCELVVNDFTQSDVATWLGISQQAVSTKLKNGSFDVRELIFIFEHLKSDPQKVGEQLTFKNNIRKGEY